MLRLLRLTALMSLGAVFGVIVLAILFPSREGIEPDQRLMFAILGAIFGLLIANFLRPSE